MRARLRRRGPVRRLELCPGGRPGAARAVLDQVAGAEPGHQPGHRLGREMEAALGADRLRRGALHHSLTLYADTRASAEARAHPCTPSFSTMPSSTTC